MLAEVRKVAASQLKAHKKHGRLFTVNTAAGGGAANGKNGDATAGSGGGGAGDALSAPMMALSLLSNTNYLIHTGLHALTLPRLPLMYPGDRAAQDRCMDKVDEARPCAPIAVFLIPPQSRAFRQCRSVEVPILRVGGAGAQQGGQPHVQVVADLKRVRDEAGNEYVALQGALLRASVKHYLTSDGTLWDSMPLKKELRDATYDMAFALVLVMNQVVSHATTSVHDVRSSSTVSCSAGSLCHCVSVTLLSPTGLAASGLVCSTMRAVLCERCAWRCCGEPSALCS